jgi:hypothetical protein
MLFDEKNDEFNYLENNKIRTVKKDEGINSAVTLYQSVVRIDDAYQDPRFDRESDKLNNTRTNSLINAALIDRHSQKKEIIGNHVFISIRHYLGHQQTQHKRRLKGMQ